MKKLEDEFDKAMMDIYKKAKLRCSYNAAYFLQMLYEHRGLETARILLADGKVQYGFTKLWECGCLDITVECLVLNKKFRRLFSDRELETAHLRLCEYGFDPEECEHPENS